MKTIYDVLQAQQAAQSAVNDAVAARVSYVDAVGKTARVARNLRARPAPSPI